jgi:hypothetical protein
LLVQLRQRLLRRAEPRRQLHHLLRQRVQPRRRIDHQIAQLLECFTLGVQFAVGLRGGHHHPGQ